MYYVAVDIGSLECAEKTTVIGIFSAKQKATLACREYATRETKHWEAEHWITVFEVEKID